MALVTVNENMNEAWEHAQKEFGMDIELVNDHIVPVGKATVAQRRAGGAVNKRKVLVFGITLIGSGGLNIQHALLANQRLGVWDVGRLGFGLLAGVSAVLGRSFGVIGRRVWLTGKQNAQRQRDRQQK